MQYPHDHENDVIYFGKTNFRNQMRKFGIKTDDRRRHVYVIGKTGMGKTTLLENMILSDIYAGHGCCYVDPHGDTAEKLLDYIPSWRINDVVYFNPADIEHPVGFNILEAVDEDMKHLVAAGMMGVFKKIWENVWSARMEYILNNTILALLDNPGSTLLGINRVLSDKEYRKQIISNVQDPIVRQFWVKEFAQYQDKFATEAVAPIQNKVGQFLSASIVRNIVAQSQSTINIRQIMDDEKIFIINLSKGRIGEDASRLLGGMLITKVQMSAMERVDTPEDQRNDFYLYVDEFQNFAVESFASILSEARKYRLNLIMAHQYIAQLTEEVRDAVFGNVGTMISFRVGSPDAQFMEDEFMPRFTPEDIINLPKFSIYLKLMIDGVTSQPFSAATLPPIAHRTDSEQKVIQQSRERYAGERSKIETRVAEWSGFAGEDIDMEKEFGDALKSAKKARKQASFAHKYNCTRCEKEFGLPVELDRARPIYCEDCMPIVKEERKNKKKGKGGGRNQEKKKKEEAKPIPKPPKTDDGDLIVKESKEEVGLSALAPKEEKSESGEKKKNESKKEEAKSEEVVEEIAKPDEPTAGEIVQPKEETLPEMEKAPEPTPKVGTEEQKPEKKEEQKRDQEASEKKEEKPKEEKNDEPPKDGEQPVKRKRKRRRRRKKKKGGSDGNDAQGSGSDNSGSVEKQDQQEKKPEKELSLGELAAPKPKKESKPEKKEEQKNDQSKKEEQGAAQRVAPGQVVKFES